jgi:hypothetical protein
VSSLAETIDEVERLYPTDIVAARKLLRSHLFQESQSDEKGSFGDALAILARSKTEHRDLAAAVIRFLALPDLLPEPNAANRIARSVVEIATGSLPDLCDFLGISSSSQTYENFAILKGAHERISSLLAPLTRGKSSLESFWPQDTR